MNLMNTLTDITDHEQLYETSSTSCQQTGTLEYMSIHYPMVVQLSLNCRKSIHKTPHATGVKGFYMKLNL